jgi:diguanylate cyclase (GGDEF)-like protein/PAS domain S-box-containing protein
VTNSLARKILLIEDNAGDVRLLTEMFRDEGPHDIELAHVDCVGAAEKYLLERSPHIILLDLGLPDAQGVDAIRRIRAAAPHVPVVVLTGLDDESMASRALQAGAQDYLIKGEIEPRGLLRALRYAMERMVTEEALFVEKGLAQLTLNCIGDAVACTDREGNISFLNDAAQSMTGWTQHDAAGLPAETIFPIVDATTREPVPDPMEMRIGRNRTVDLPPNCILVRRDGIEIPIEDTVATIYDREGHPAGAVIVFRDVSAARAMASQITHLAEHDFLTGLPNRMLLNDRIGQAIASASRYGHKAALLFLDLDGFKHINDSLGHPAGDKLLQSVARRLSETVEASSTVSRQGGDEFIVLLARLDCVEDVVAIAKRMLEAIAGPHRIDDDDLHVTTSIGISVYPDDGPDAETLIKNADTAMFQAKENGRQIYQFFEPAMSVRAVERQSIEESLRRALQREEFTLHYQPKINLATGEVTGAEALIRWLHPTRGLIAPDQFIPIAEECGLILPITRWVLREACSQAQAWLAAGLPRISMAVNISALDFRAETFLESVFAIIDETGIDPRSLELELTEGVLMRRTETTELIFNTLKERGVQLAVDDFGTGYSSLSYLRSFPIDAIKIDQSFIRQLSVAPDDTSIVRAMIDMGRNLKLRVIAEGVETQSELAFLRAHQCDEAQGFLFSRPLLPGAFAELLDMHAFQLSGSGLVITDR